MKRPPFPVQPENSPIYDVSLLLNAVSAMAKTDSNPSFPLFAFCMIVSADQSSILFDSFDRYVNAIILELDLNSVCDGEKDDCV